MLKKPDKWFAGLLVLGFPSHIRVMTYDLRPFRDPTGPKPEGICFLFFRVD